MSEGRFAASAATMPYILAAARGLALLTTLLFVACGGMENTVNPRLADEMPQKIVWAWERSENLTFLDPNEYGVAFLAQTIYLEKNQVVTNSRRQPLEIAPGSYLIAVTRIETTKDTFKRSSMTDDVINKIAWRIRATMDLPDVRAIQIDFDAVSSERSFYERLVRRVRKELDDLGRDKHVPLTMTSLASWCTGDAWFNDFPVDEAVPMIFQMGADGEKILNFLQNGNDWNEPLCRGSYGISIDERIAAPLRAGRRVYYFSNAAWRPGDRERMRLP